MTQDRDTYVAEVADLDAVAKGADWSKAKWDLPAPGTPEYEHWKALHGDALLRPAWPELADGEDAKPPAA